MLFSPLQEGYAFNPAVYRPFNAPVVTCVPETSPGSGLCSGAGEWILFKVMPMFLSDLLILALLLRRKHLVEAVEGWSPKLESHNKKTKNE